MHWLEKRNGWVVREGSHNRRWTITSSYFEDRVGLNLTHWTSDGIAVETRIAQCMSAAEAQIFATALDSAGHPAGTKINELLISKGFKEAPHFSRDVEREVMEAVCKIRLMASVTCTTIAGGSGRRTCRSSSRPPELEYSRSTA
ncbi:hypothetical protein [Devosia chinhatensis]|uniref:Uncharacterized protein n=1 Tax=Devosia chinhatensis TaxID=429727 RepID=A0A0F5FIY7_9HYPH|nr:hypothetical protein [Devosia chinhatensis]KKB08811.1 hypothetical protein VE26_01700 [Devosia chinhatensis]